MSAAGAAAGRPTSLEAALSFGYTILPAENDGWVMVESMGLDGDPDRFRGRPIAAFSNSVDLMAFLMTAHSVRAAERGEATVVEPEGGVGGGPAGDDALGVVRAFMRRA